MSSFGKNKENLQTLITIKDTFNSMIKDFHSRFSKEELDLLKIEVNAEDLILPFPNFKVIDNLIEQFKSKLGNEK